MVTEKLKNLLLESYKSTNSPPLTAQQICQRYCLTPTSVTLTAAEEPSSVCAGVRLCVQACFCMLCRWLLAHGCVRLKLPANYGLNASISREQTDSAARVSLGHYHRLSCSLKPEVTTALVCTACRVLFSAYGMEGNRSSPVISM